MRKEGKGGLYAPVASHSIRETMDYFTSITLAVGAVA